MQKVVLALGLVSGSALISSSPLVYDLLTLILTLIGYRKVREVGS